MADYDRATLQIGGGTFEMAGSLTVTESIRTGYLVGGTGSTVWSFVGNLAGVDESKREQFFIDLGAGAHTVEVSFEGWEGAQDADGNSLQWGDTGDSTTLTKTDATGAHPVAQMQCLIGYLKRNTADSFGAGTLEYGQRTSDSSTMFDPLRVAVEGPNIRKAFDEGRKMSGEITLVSTGDIREAIDAAVQVPW